MDSPRQKIDTCVAEVLITKKYNMASVDQFKSAVVRIRDILRGPGMSITGMDSMRHICLYLLARYITLEKARELGVPKKFAWENLMAVLPTSGGKQNALDSFYHQHDESLVSHFDRLFGTEKFSFDVKNLDKHKEILEILDGINMGVVDMEIDILGYVYEQHLKTGSSAARDLGQFFTDRFICHYMTELCKPGFKKSGIPESVCDPSMGTGGFLTAYIKYYKTHHPSKMIDWSVHQQEIYGCDTDMKVAGVARLNLFMESGGSRFENLLTHDSLYGDLPKTGFDIILANMPFGLKGLTYKECCDRVKALKINGTKSEPLFLQLMMVSLNRGGRCAVVVPDGMLVNGSACHDGTRKYLLDHFELKRVIKMKGKFFLNTGIQPSILFFENSGKPTSAVEFWDVVNDDKGSITETMVISVPREKFGPNCFLDMRPYMEAEKSATNSAGFPTMKLVDVCNYQNGKTLSSSDKTEHGMYDVMGGGMSYNGKTDTYNREGETISISKSGASAGFIAYHNKKYWAGDCLTITPKNDNIRIKYLYYYLKINNHLTMQFTSGSTIPHCKWDDIKNIQIPIPPLLIQEEIIRTLDTIYTPGTTELMHNLQLNDKALDMVLANSATKSQEPIMETQHLIRKSLQMVTGVNERMIADLKVQMVAIMKSVRNRGFPMVKLGDICNDVSTNKNIPSSERKDGEFKFFTCSRDYSSHNSFHYEGTYIIHGSRGSTISESVFLTKNEKFAIGTSMFMSKVNDENKTNPAYIYYYLRLYSIAVENLINSSAIPMISKTSYYTIELPLPPLSFQNSIVSRLEVLQSQVSALESIQNQAEDNARFILESYLYSV